MLGVHQETLNNPKYKVVGDLKMLQVLIFPACKDM